MAPFPPILSPIATKIIGLVATLGSPIIHLCHVGDPKSYGVVSPREQDETGIIIIQVRLGRSQPLHESRWTKPAAQ